MVSAIVIGAGLGGIATAARLARQGYQVTIYEKNDIPGGRAAVIERDGYRFDTGPTLFLMPEVFEETFRAFGERMDQHLELQRLDPTYRVHFHDGTHLDLTSNLVEMREQLEAMEAGAFGAYLKFLAEGYNHYNLSLEKFVGRNFRSIFEYFNPVNLPLLIQLKALTTHASNTGRYFKDPRLLAAFSFQNMYLGLSPYEAPATFSLLQYTELADGVWFPKGGLYKVIEVFTAIAESLGVQFVYNAPVRRIDIEGGRASGITLENGEHLKADVVIANADLPYVYSELLPEDGSRQKLAKKKYTSSALMFYWGIRGPKSSNLLHHNVFLADDQYQASFDRIFKDLSLPDVPSFYINAPSRSEAGFAPADGDGLMALVPVGHINDEKPQDWESLESKARKFVIDRLQAMGLGDIPSRMVFEERISPNTYQNKWNLAKGSAFGLSHNFLQVGYLRPQNRHARYPNLYFVGASTHPGTGLPIVLLSAKLTVERIIEEGPKPV